MPKKLAIISTHPIQYYAPIFRLLAKHIDIKVFYTLGNAKIDQYDYGFNQKISWDIPLLEGYHYEFLNNTAKKVGSHHFSGIANPDAMNRIKSYQPDAILIYGWAYSSHLKIIKYFSKKLPVYFRGDSTLLNEKSGLKSFLKSIFLKWVYQSVDSSFYVGSKNKSYFKKYGLREEQLIFAPHAIDNNRFAENRLTEAQQLKDQLGIRPSDVVILFAGKLIAVKNPTLLLRAFQELSIPGAHLLFVGNGNLEAELKKMSDTSSTITTTKIHFMDFQNQTQMPVIYQACDLFCLPSVSETWGLGVNEAMAAGKAILVSDQVGCASDLVSEDNGAIFKSGNLTDLKQKLLALSINKAELKKMGEKSKKIIKNWSFEQQVAAILNYVNR